MIPEGQDESEAERRERQELTKLLIGSKSPLSGLLAHRGPDMVDEDSDDEQELIDELIDDKSKHGPAVESRNADDDDNELERAPTKIPEVDANTRRASESTLGKSQTIQEKELKASENSTKEIARPSAKDCSATDSDPKGFSTDQLWFLETMMGQPSSPPTAPPPRPITPITNGDKGFDKESYLQPPNLQISQNRFEFFNKIKVLE